MSQVNCLDSIINKYKDRLLPKPIILPCYSSLDPKNTTPQKSPQLSTTSKPLRQSTLQNTQSPPNPYVHSSLLPSLSNSQHNKLSFHQPQPASLSLLKYKQTLSLYYDQIAKNRKLLSEINTFSDKMKIAELRIKELEHLRLNEKLQYAQKLEILNNTQRESKSVMPNELMRRVAQLEKEVWYLRRGEEEYQRKIRLLQDTHGDLSTRKTQTDRYHRTPISNSRLNTRNRNPSNQQMSFHEPRLQTIPSTTTNEFGQLKQTLLKLQQQHSVIVTQNEHLKEEIGELNCDINQYKYKIEELENTFREVKNEQENEGNRRSNRKTTRRNKTESNTDESVISGSSAEQKQQGKGNKEIERKLKNLQRDYEKICSQMLTVESATKIAKQTSKYYNNINKRLR